MFDSFVIGMKWSLSVWLGRYLLTILSYSVMDKDKVDPELQEFLEVEQQKAQLQGQVP